MENEEYEEAWAEGEDNMPLESAAKKAHMAKQQEQAREFSEAFFSDEVKPEQV